MSSVNLALNKPTAQSTFILPYNSQKSVDGSLSPISRWLSNSLPAWLSVDLGNTFWIDRWVVRHMGTAGWSSPAYNMKNFILQKSINSTLWSDVDIIQNNTSPVTDKTVTPFQSRYVRIYITSGLNINHHLASIVEFEVYEASNPGRGIALWVF